MLPVDVIAWVISSADCRLELQVR